MTLAEFSRPERLDQLGEQPRTVAITADADERAALARRFGLIALTRLDARFDVRRLDADVLVEGHVTATLTQACSVTGTPLPVALDEPVSLRFAPADRDAADETELADGDLDTAFYTGNAIDLGEAAAETMALALDPFPRGPDAAAALAEAGVMSEEAAGPFGALAALRDTLGRT